MNKNLKNYIIKSDIPDDLKEYLSKSKNTYNLLSMKIIDDWYVNSILDSLYRVLSYTPSVSYNLAHHVV